MPISGARTSKKKLGKNQQNLPLFHLTILTLTSISLETKPDRLQPHATQVQVLSKQFHSWLCRSLTFILVEVVLLFSSWEQINVKHFQVLDITDCLLWGVNLAIYYWDMERLENHFGIYIRTET